MFMKKFNRLLSFSLALFLAFSPIEFIGKVFGEIDSYASSIKLFEDDDGCYVSYNENSKQLVVKYNDDTHFNSKWLSDEVNNNTEEIVVLGNIFPSSLFSYIGLTSPLLQREYFQNVRKVYAYDASNEITVSSGFLNNILTVCEEVYIPKLQFKSKDYTSGDFYYRHSLTSGDELVSSNIKVLHMYKSDYLFNAYDGSSTVLKDWLPNLQELSLYYCQSITHDPRGKYMMFKGLDSLTVESIFGPSVGNGFSMTIECPRYVNIGDFAVRSISRTYTLDGPDEFFCRQENSKSYLTVSVVNFGTVIMPKCSILLGNGERVVGEKSGIRVNGTVDVVDIKDLTMILGTGYITNLYFTGKEKVSADLTKSMFTNVGNVYAIEGSDHCKWLDTWRIDHIHITDEELNGLPPSLTAATKMFNALSPKDIEFEASLGSGKNGANSISTVTVDNNSIPDNCWSFDSSSNKLTISQDYLSTLQNGSHPLAVLFDNDEYCDGCNIAVINSQVNNKTLESISFSGVKQEYTIGDEVDKTGKYILHYSDGTTEEHDIPVDKFDGITTDAEKTYTLIIEQDGVSGQIEISVNRPDKVASSIAVTGVTKNYNIGDIFDGKGKIVISYTDGTSNEIELLENMISGFDTSEAGLVTVTVTYNGLTTTFDINVKEASGGTQPPTEEAKPPVALTTLTYEFYKDYPDDVIIPLQMNDATDVTVVKVGSETLTENDYELVDSAIVLKKEFLENLEEAKHWVRLTFNDKANTIVSNIVLQVYDELGSSEKPVLLYKRIVYDGNQFELPFVSGTGDYEAHDVDALIVDGTMYLPNGLEMPYSKSLVNEIALMRTYIGEDNDILYNDYEEDIIDEEDEYYETATPSNTRRVATSSNAVKKSNSNTKKLTSRQQDIIDALTVDDSGRVFTVENDTIIVDNDWFESLGIEEDNNYLLGAVFSNNDKTVDDKKVVISVPKGYDNLGGGEGDGEQKPPTGDGEQKPPTGDGSDGEQKPPTGGDEGTEKPPTGGDGETENPPTGGDEGTEKPPTGGDGSGTEKPPTGDGSETEKPPTGDGGNQGTTKPPTGEGDGGNQGTTKPPTGEGDGSTTKPPTDGGNGSTGNPPIDDGNDGATKPPTGDGSTNPPSGGNNSGTNTDGNNGEQNSGSNTPNRRPSHSSDGSGGSSSSTSNKTPTSPAVNSDGSLNTGYRPSVPNNGGTFVLDENGNKVYKFPDGSIPLSTWVGDGKNWYYQNKDGFIETGWFLDNDGSWYMLCKEKGDNYGAMLCGWYFEIADGKWYFLNPADGRMLIGWHHINNKWYYLNERADEQTYFGDNVNGWFYNSAARPFGSMWCNEITPDGYKVASNGEWMK